MPSPPTAPDRSDDEVTRLDGLTIDAGRHEVSVDDEPVELTSLEFQLLAALAEAPGRVFTRRQLIERVWGWDFYGDERLVDVHIGNLRRALGDAADDPRFIGTVRGWATSASGARGEPRLGPRRLRTRLFLSYVVVVAAGAIAMVVVGAAVTRTVYERRLGGFGFGRGQGRSLEPTESQLTAALDDSLVPALVFGVVAALGRRGDRGDDRRCPPASTDRRTPSGNPPDGGGRLRHAGTGRRPRPNSPRSRTT